MHNDNISALTHEVSSASRRRRAIELLVIAALVFAAAYIGTAATIPNIPTWYAALNKPSFNPPNWLFGPVWTVLYGVMVWSFWRVLNTARGQPSLRLATFAFGVQLVLNALWSVVFFGMHRPGLALLVVAALEVSVIVMILRFARIDRWAAGSQLPYAFWVAFASILNLSIFLLNLPDAVAS